MIRLSQRNLLTLLYDLETRGERHLQKPGVGMITAETDERHYKGREFGRMTPPVEAFIVKMKKAIRRAEQTCEQNPPEWALTAARDLLGDYANTAGVIATANVITKYAHEAGAW